MRNTSITQNPIARNIRIGICTPLIASIFSIAGLSACSEGGKDDAKGLDPKSLCDSSLDSKAVHALRKVSKVERFEELGGFKASDVGESLWKQRKTQECSIYSAEDEEVAPLLKIRFTADSLPDKESSSDTLKEKKYPIGYQAEVTSLGASIYFKCKIKNLGRNEGIQASMYAPESGFKRGDAGQYRMAILNSVSRKVAHSLGCGAETRLPEEVPE